MKTSQRDRAWYIHDSISPTVIWCDLQHQSCDTYTRTEAILKISDLHAFTYEPCAPLVNGRTHFDSTPHAHEILNISLDVWTFSLPASKDEVCAPLVNPRLHFFESRSCHTCTREKAISKKQPMISICATCIHQRKGSRRQFFRPHFAYVFANGACFWKNEKSWGLP